MTHIILFIEGYSESIVDFKKDWDGRIYANGKAKLRMREPVLLTCSINEEGRDEFLADILALSTNTEGYTTKSNQSVFGWNRLVSWAKRFGRLLGVKEIDTSKIKPNQAINTPGQKNFKHYNMNTFIIGEVPDRRYQLGELKGKEMV